MNSKEIELDRAKKLEHVLRDLAEIKAQLKALKEVILESKTIQETTKTTKGK